LASCRDDYRRLGRLQAFPWKSWEEEFRHARACGFNTIEWLLFEADGYEQNPIWTDSGLEKIHRLIASSGVQVRTLCADYFMTHPFFRVLENDRAVTVAVLNNLIVQAAKVGIVIILLPVWWPAKEITSALHGFSLHSFCLQSCQRGCQQRAPPGF